MVSKRSTPEKQCHSVLFLHFFREVVIHACETIQRKQLRDRQLSSGVRSESGIALGGESTDLAKAATDFTDFVLGGEVISDPVDLTATPLSNVAVSLFLPEKTPLTTVHWRESRPPTSRRRRTSAAMRI